MLVYDYIWADTSKLTIENDGNISLLFKKNLLSFKCPRGLKGRKKKFDLKSISMYCMHFFYNLYNFQFFLIDSNYTWLSHSLNALQLAKKTIEEKYSVVGIAEDFTNTLILLEHYIPGSKSNRIFICLFVLKDLNNHLTEMFHLYSKASHRSWECL